MLLWISQDSSFPRAAQPQPPSLLHPAADLTGDIRKGFNLPFPPLLALLSGSQTREMSQSYGQLLKTYDSPSPITPDFSLVLGEGR